MTYTYKLARRLAISRTLAMLPPALALFAGCAGETTAPETPIATQPSVPTTAVSFRVLPGTVTIEVEQRTRFRGELHRVTGQDAPPVSWEASGGFIDSAGFFTADRPGTYRIIGRVRSYHTGRGTRWNTVHSYSRHRPDTATVVVVPQQPDLAAIRVRPRNASLKVGENRDFSAVGVLADGRQVPIGIEWSATGGTVSPSGLYQAGTEAGTYRVIATNTSGTHADTVRVRIQAGDTVSSPAPEPSPDPTPEPTPEPSPEPQPPTLAQVVLKPASVSLATLATRQFTVFGRTSSGDSIAVAATFTATGGTITSTGLYAAGGTAGTYRVMASAEGLADTAIVTLTAASGGGTVAGIPFGPYDAWSGTTSLKPATAVFTSNITNLAADAVVARLESARQKGVRIMSMMNGGHEPYLTNGVFDMAKWKAKMDLYNTPAIKAAVAAAVADGTLIGNSVMDEPHVYGLGDGNTWGPKGTMTKARVDTLCAYVKTIFPTLPVGVVHQHHIFEPEKAYRVCEFIVDQYSYRFGSATTFRDDALAMSRRDGIAIAFSMNIMNGGIPAARDGQWNCPLTTTGGRGTYEPNCRMTAAQVREWGLLLGTEGCAMLMWRYDDTFMANPANQQAFTDIARNLATRPGRPCTGT